MEDTELLSSDDQKMEDASTENPITAGAVPPSPDDSDESDSDSEDEAESNHQIQTLESELSTNPYNYDAYVQYIKLLRKTADLEKLRQAREAMSAIFPLSPSMWIEWAKDEASLASSDNVPEIVMLYERGLSDYQSVALWCDYLDYLLEFDPSVRGYTSEGIAKMRSLFERAIPAAGFHVTEGNRIWEGYRKFEQGILATIDQDDSEGREKQIQRIRSIFHRHLSVPLENLSSTLLAYKTWELEQGIDLDIGSDDLSKVSPQVAGANKKALQMYSERAHLEGQISKEDLSDTEKFQQFMNYIKFEQTSGDPTRVQAMYERAVAEYPVSSDLWIDYTCYLDKTLKVGKAITHAYSRATRSCPWIGDLWARYLLALERGSALEKEIYAVFEKSLKCNFSSFEEYLDLYLTRVDGLRRRMVSTRMVEILDYSLIRETFQQASDYLTPHMQNTESSVRLHAYWAKLELSIGKDLAGARGVWDNFLKKSGGMLAAWQAYIDMEVHLGHIKEARSIYRRCYTRKFDGTGSEDIYHGWLTFEREHGALEDYDHALQKMSGLEVLDNGLDYYGVFVLQGKLLNVRNASKNVIDNNKEIKELKSMLGLRDGMTTFDNLRYGKVMIMTDEDYDGYHIKALIINFFHYLWPELLKRNQPFICEFITPIMKGTHKDKGVVTFYSMRQYEAWKQNKDGYEMKYYKGLGTHTDEEAKQYFEKFELHKKDLIWIDDEEDQDGKAIQLAFSKENGAKRREWVENYQETPLDRTLLKERRISEFIHKELILFSRANNLRSIPSLVDGLKPAQRKTLFCLLERKSDKEYKVSEFSAYVSENTNYHHGEKSIQNTIIKMAQDYVGSHNIPLLIPKGQFGTRLLGGKDAASARYIFTMISSITRLLFHPDDDVLLPKENGETEPNMYIPIIPTILVNGCEGIGTGYNTFIPKFSTKEIIRNTKRLINGELITPMIPCYKGFKGDIKRIKDGYLTEGKYRKDGLIIHIEELPINHRINYKKFLHQMKTSNGNAFIKDIIDRSTKSIIHFELHMSKQNMDIAEEQGIMTMFKLTTKLSTKNMCLFDDSYKVIKRYSNEEAIFEEFYKCRIDYYKKRKSHMIQDITENINKLNEKRKFLCQISKGDIKYNQDTTKEELINMLSENGFQTFNSDSTRSGFEYLLEDSYVFVCITEEKEKVNRKIDELETEYSKLVDIDPKIMWLKDIEYLEIELEKLYPSGVSGSEGVSGSGSSSEASGVGSQASGVSGSVSGSKRDIGEKMKTGVTPEKKTRKVTTERKD